ncbi:alpha/beta fold hydrolase [Pseudonocardia sp. RS010]|uniref:alpha/beta fold hydrolase n=1 Tax=Pseudonocardia sp. RS010 TaxID=3385979 RepID=UPI0039A26C69
MSHTREVLVGAPTFAEVTRPTIGSRPDECVVFVHGLGGNSTVFYPLQEVVAEHRTTVSVDLKGLGRSRTTLPRNFDDWVEQVLGAVAHAGRFDRLSLVGHSLGTLISRHVAARDPRVRVQVLFGPVSAPGDAQRPQFEARASAAFSGGMAPVADGFGVASLGSTTLRSAPLAVAMVREFLLGQDPAGYAACCSLVGRAEEPGPPAHENCRTLLVYGREDPICPEPSVRALVEALDPTVAETLALDGIGHWPTVEDLAASEQGLLRWLELAEEGTPLLDVSAASRG